MKWTGCFLAFLVSLNAVSVASAGSKLPVADPAAASMEITELVADAKPDEAVAAVQRNLPPMTATSLNLEQMRSALRLITQNGKGDLTDEVLSKKYGNSVHIVVHYVHFPRQESPVNQFLFIRYTFMKGQTGWVMTTFDFKTSGTFPPSAWSN